MSPEKHSLQTDSEAMAERVFGPPEPLTSAPPIPEFPSDALPPAIREMVEAVAEATQTDVAMAGASALATLSACTGGHAQIESRPGWTEPLCIYSVTVASPGERKSAVHRALTDPVYEVEREVLRAFAGEREEALTLKSIAEDRAKQAQREAARATGTDAGDLERAAADAARLAAGMTVPSPPTLIADDVTPEAAVSLAADNGGRLAVISAEGGLFDIMAGRYSSGRPHFDFFLKAHAGDRAKTHRVGRADEYIDRPAVTLALMIQPSVLDSLARQEQFAGRGLLARFLWTLPESNVGQRKTGGGPDGPAPVPEAVREAYRGLIAGLATELSGWQGDPVVLRLSPEAARLQDAHEAKVETMLAEGGYLAITADVREWGAKFAGAVLRLAGLLHFAEHGHNGFRLPVEERTMADAIRLGDYFRDCALNVFARLGEPGVVADAKALLEAARSLTRETGGEPVSERAIHQKVRGSARFKLKASVMPGLGLLVEYGYLRESPESIRRRDRSEQAGRKASPEYLVYTPDLYSESPQSSQWLSPLDSEDQEDIEDAPRSENRPRLTRLSRLSREDSAVAEWRADSATLRASTPQKCRHNEPLATCPICSTLT